MEHATGARRIIEATPRRAGVMEFGSRRADGPEAAIDSSIYGLMAGCIGTSNVMAAKMVNKKALGTMAHSWIESFDTELESFIAYANTYPNNCMLLVDTYDTLRSGVPNAIKTFEYMKQNNLPTNNIGIRIDSGDLAYLSKEARRMFIEAGFPQAKICLSNGLNEYTIRDLLRYSTVASDNAAHNMLMDYFGRNNMLSFWKNLGTTAIFTVNNNWGVTNAHDASIYMEELYRFYIEDEKYGYAYVTVNEVVYHYYVFVYSAEEYEIDGFIELSPDTTGYNVITEADLAV